MRSPRDGPWRARMGTVLLCAATAVLLGGCCCFPPGKDAGATSTGPPLYYQGKLEQTLEAPLADVHEACVRALQDIMLPAIEDRADRISAHLKSAYPDGEPVWIDLTALGKRHTRVTVRVGLAGERQRAAYVLSRIKEYLKATGG